MTYSSKLTRRRISIDGANLFHFQLWIVAPVNLYTKYFYITVNPISIRNKKKITNIIPTKICQILVISSSIAGQNNRNYKNKNRNENEIQSFR